MPAVHRRNTEGGGVKLLEGLAASMDAIDERVDLNIAATIDALTLIARVARNVELEQTAREAEKQIDRLVQVAQ